MKKIVAKTNTTIAFFINLHIVMIRDLNRFYVFVPVDVVKDLGKIKVYFK